MPSVFANSSALTLALCNSTHLWLLSALLLIATTLSCKPAGELATCNVTVGGSVLVHEDCLVSPFDARGSNSIAGLHDAVCGPPGLIYGGTAVQLAFASGNELSALGNAQQMQVLLYPAWRSDSEAVQGCSLQCHLSLDLHGV